ncbi:unnamed protein product [Owenia fusiformis]|uniref:TIR domain-containing protein n=1 Tax=Owenia fusiformis TaxID=6347 RepID=A0A8S4N2N3_OWEFU|nr:unnamed protein product [Owenia fusiformis]
MTHVMLSYQWDKQKMVEQVFNGLMANGIPAWMDIKEGGMSGNINDSMAHGVDNAIAVICFMSPKYQESKNCKKELNYTDSLDKTIIPCMTQRGFKATQWLGIITAGLLWIDFREETNMAKRIDSLIKEIMHQVGDNIKMIPPPQEPAIKAAPKVTVEKKPGRAFRHKLSGKYLAESGEVKFHPASGNRSNLVTTDTPKDTSYWVEESKKGSEVYFYKNFHSNGYLGYDPNGDYIYTKGQHYGAEEWNIIADETCSTGERSVVLFAAYGKKYLAIRNGKFTGVSKPGDDCIWILD